MIQADFLRRIQLDDRTGVPRVDGTFFTPKLLDKRIEFETAVELCVFRVEGKPCAVTRVIKYSPSARVSYSTWTSGFVHWKENQALVRA